MTSEGPTPETDKALSDVIYKTRPAVMMIWVLVLVASYLGIATPI